MSHVMCHVSHVTCHVSHVKFFVFFCCFFVKVVKLIGGGSVINGANPVCEQPLMSSMDRTGGEVRPHPLDTAWELLVLVDHVLDRLDGQVHHLLGAHAWGKDGQVLDVMPWTQYSTL